MQPGACTPAIIHLHTVLAGQPCAGHQQDDLDQLAGQPALHHTQCLQNCYCLLLWHCGDLMMGMSACRTALHPATHQDEVEQRGLVHLDKLGVPLLDVVLALGGLVVHLLVGLHVELAVLDDLGQDLAGHIGQRDDVLSARVCRRQQENAAAASACGANRGELQFGCLYVIRGESCK